jgi:hypothetical protein
MAIAHVVILGITAARFDGKADAQSEGNLARAKSQKLTWHKFIILSSAGEYF